MNETQNDLQAAFDTASAHFHEGRIEAAKLACRDILAADPAHADAIQLYGLIAHIAGEHQTAASLINHAIQLKGAAAPPEYFNNMGLVLRTMGHDDHAVAHFQRAIQLKPDHANAHVNLGLTLQTQGKLDDAISHYRHAAAAQPDSADIAHHLGGAHYARGNRKEAAASYEKALALKPDHAQAHNDLGVVLKDLGQFTEAQTHYERAINLDPDNDAPYYNLGLLMQDRGSPEKALESFERAAALGNASAPFWVSTLKGTALDQAPREYVETLFDSYAQNFESHLLGKLRYEAPQILRRMIDALDARRYARAVDLGCGTGLSGIAFKDRVDRMIGVDLSSQMLRKAAEKNIYERLEAADLESFLKGETDKFDLFIAADVLIYIGNVEGLFTAIADRANRGARFAFTTEISADLDFRLEAAGSKLPTGHYSHARPYLERMLAQTGARVIAWENHPTRMHNNAPVTGHYVIVAFD